MNSAHLITLSLIVFQVLGLHILYGAAVNASMQPSWGKAMVIFAALFHFFNLISVFTLHAMSAKDVFHNDCATLLPLFDVLFIVFEVTAHGSLIWALTSVLQERVRAHVRIGLYFLLTVALGSLSTALAIRKSAIEDDRCITVGGIGWKYVGKYTLTGLHGLLLAASLFVTLVVYTRRKQLSHHGVKALEPSQQSTPPSKAYITLSNLIEPNTLSEKSFFIFTLKMTIVFSFSAVTTGISAAGATSIYKFVLYSFQNYFTILAAKVSSGPTTRKFRK
jgi:hypothetical protein